MLNVYEVDVRMWGHIINVLDSVLCVNSLNDKCLLFVSEFEWYFLIVGYEFVSVHYLLVIKLIFCQYQ